jgi:hypothetical protein
MGTDNAAKFLRLMHGLLQDEDEPAGPAQGDHDRVAGQPGRSAETGRFDGAPSPAANGPLVVGAPVLEPPPSHGATTPPARPTPSLPRASVAVGGQGSRGLCESCSYRRQGASVANATFRALVRSFQPEVRETHTRALVEEESQQGESEDELASQVQMAALAKQDETRWSSRPRGLWYCGVHEFDDTYYIGQIRNGPDLACASYEPLVDRGRSHTCDTCAHCRRTSEQVLRVLKDAFFAGGTQGRSVLNGQVLPALGAQAMDEYQTCVDNAGFLSAPPTFLPYCAAHSSEPGPDAYGRFVVGPVVNSDARCTRWQPGTGHDDEPDAELAALVTHAERLKTVAASIQFKTTPGGPMWVDVERAEGSARANIIAHCLRKLLANEDVVRSICTAFTQGVWSTEWEQSLNVGGEFLTEDVTRDIAGGRPLAPFTIPGPQQGGAGFMLTPGPAPPFAPTPDSSARPPRRRGRGRRRRRGGSDAEAFVLMPGVSYAHPDHPETSLTITTAPMRVAAVVQHPAGTWAYDLLTFPSGVWTRLENNGTGVPIELNVQLPAAVYARW